jgi:hypothetical protein
LAPFESFESFKSFESLESFGSVESGRMSLQTPEQGDEFTLPIRYHGNLVKRKFLKYCGAFAVFEIIENDPNGFGLKYLVMPKKHFDSYFFGNEKMIGEMSLSWTNIPDLHPKTSGDDLNLVHKWNKIDYA